MLNDKMNLLLSEIQIHLSVVFYLTILYEDKEGREGEFTVLTVLSGFTFLGESEQLRWVRGITAGFKTLHQINLSSINSQAMSGAPHCPRISLFF